MTATVQQVKELVEAQMARLRGPEDVAQALGMNYETLRKAFRREAGMSLGAYLSIRRIQRTKDYLLRTDLQCAEILFKVGFDREDSGHRAFRRIEGMTMSTYRKLNHGMHHVIPSMPPMKANHDCQEIALASIKKDK